MTITPKHVRTSMDASATVLRNLAPRIAEGVGTCHLMIESGGDLERREDAGVRGKNWITDPTGQTALARLATYERTVEDVEQYIDTLRITITLLTKWAEKHAPTTTERTRCHASGPDSVAPWARPDCTELVGYYIRNDGTRSDRGDGLCDRCRQAKGRYERSLSEQ
jgi:hypothetical protein